jgi:hypothetical protein
MANLAEENGRLGRLRAKVTTNAERRVFLETCRPERGGRARVRVVPLGGFMIRLRMPLSIVVVLVATAAWVGCSGKVAPSPAEDNDAGIPSPDDPPSDPPKDPPPPPPTDAGPTPMPEAGTPLTYGTCANFNACGGNIAASWSVSGGCASSDAFGELRKQCAGLKESNVKINASGTLSANGTALTRKLSTTVSANIEIPKSCLPLPACAIIGTLLTSGQVPGIPKFDTATCTDSASACQCSVGLTATQDSTVPYTTAGSVLTTGGSAQTFNYCVAGDKLALQEVRSANGNSFSIPVTLELTRTGNP